MSEMTAIKINDLTIEQYIHIIEKKEPDNLPEAVRDAVMEKLRCCIWFHHKYNKEERTQNVWACFISVLELFRYVCTSRYETAMDAKLLLERYHSDEFVNPQKVSLGINLGTERYLFEEKKVDNREYNNNPVFTWIDQTKSEKENCDLLLRGVNRNTTVEAALRHMWKYVKEDKSGYERLALTGFDTELQDMRQIQGEICELDKFFDALPDQVILRQCKKMYDAGVKQIVLTGAPGTGKTFTVNSFAERMTHKAYLNLGRRCTKAELDGHIERVQFHASYDYSDFVEGLRPAITGDRGEMSFVRMDGIFKKFCRRIMEKGDALPYFFIIDEINRADLSRVFGELMYCLDENNRTGESSAEEVNRVGVTTQYAGLPTFVHKACNGKAEPVDDDIYAEKFAIPKNLYILATMNDIDRSVEAFDFALRRRFKWIEVDANTEIEYGLMGMLGQKRPMDENTIFNLAARVKAMNNRISEKDDRLLLDTSYHIGHAYFRDFDGTKKSLQDIWDTQIRMILQEYCRGKDKDTTKKLVDDCREILFKGLKDPEYITE